MPVNTSYPSTGSASWMYRAGLESILGFKLSGETLRIEPCVPYAWDKVGMSYRRGKTTYEILINNSPDGFGARIELDGVPVASGAIPLVDDGMSHKIHLQLKTTH